MRRTKRSKPSRYPLVKNVLVHTEREECVHIQQKSHGKSASSSSTCSVVRGGASAPASKTGQPVAGSLMIRAFRLEVFGGLKIIWSPSISTSRESPALSPRRERTWLGRTTWPFVESLVRTVRQSYPENRPKATSRDVSWLSAIFRPSTHTFGARPGFLRLVPESAGNRLGAPSGQLWAQPVPV
jgi:hypothetical protein